MNSNLKTELGKLKSFELKEDSQSLYKVVKDNLKDKIEVELGDSKDSSEVFPQAKIKRWNNGVNLSVRYKEDSSKDIKSIEVKNNALIWNKGKEEVHIYEKPEIAEDGGLEIEVVLKEKPASNVIGFSIETKGLDFFYQPELTLEEIKKGAVRPENVVGSYAVYHKDKSGNFSDKEYKTGKFCHIYRPKVIDAEGNEVWGELNIDIDSKLLTVTIDGKWLEKAIYPVIIDPTFGWTSIGASADPVISKWYWYSSRFSVDSSGDIQSISLYCVYYGATGFITLGICDTSYQRVSNCGEVEYSGTSSLWRTAETPSGSVTSGNYFIGGVASAANLAQAYDYVSTGASYYKNIGSYSLPADLSGGTLNDSGDYRVRLSVYATYTESGEGPIVGKKYPLPPFRRSV